MSDDATQALSDARLLFERFAASPWRSLEVAQGPMRLSISRLGGAARATVAALSSPIGEEEGVRLTAPHVGTVRELAPPGSTIRVGEIYATLELLDEPVPLLATKNIRIASLLSQPGEFLQFGSPLMIATSTGP